MKGKEEQKERMAESMSELLVKQDHDQEKPTKTFSLCCFFLKLYIF